MVLSFLIASLAAATAPVADVPVRYAMVSCRNVKDVPLKDCNAALISRGEGKIAVYVTAPDGRVRIIHFRRGTPSSTDAGSRLNFERSGDRLVIHVGRTEQYELPARLVTGD